MPGGRGLIADFGPLRRSRDLRLLTLGNVVAGIGVQMVLVALPYQVYVDTGSPLLTGLLGAAELVPMIAASVYGGGLVDRHDRRRVLLVNQMLLVVAAVVLAAVSLAGDPPVWALFVLAAILAGGGSIQQIARAAMVPNLVPREELRAAVALFFGLYQVASIVGPGVGGLIIASSGVAEVYVINAASALFLVLIAAALRPQRPHTTPQPMLRMIAEGLRFVRRTDQLTGAMSLDLLAMTFAMPRALFPVLSVSVYGAGAAGAGLLHTAVATGATVSALLTGWAGRTRRLGRVLVGAVLVWGAAVALAGFSDVLWLAAAMFCVAGAADSVSAVCRSAISQSVTPDELRGRMGSVYTLAVTSGPRLGDITSGTAASVIGPSATVVAGGVTCMAGAVVLARHLPALVRYDASEWLASATPPRPSGARTPPAARPR